MHSSQSVIPIAVTIPENRSEHGSVYYVNGVCDGFSLPSVTVIDTHLPAYQHAVLLQYMKRILVVVTMFFIVILLIFYVRFDNIHLFPLLLNGPILANICVRALRE